MRWTAVLCAVALMGCAELAVEEEPTPEPTVEETQAEEPEPEPGPVKEESDLPGDYAEIIGSETDCAKLQEIFDTAENMDASDEKVAIMKAADERMAEVGCYD